MNRVLKSFVYIAACTAVFVLLTSYYDDLFQSGQAVAFEWEKPVNVYFIDRGLLETTDCTASVPLRRMVPNAESLGLGALDALIKGLTDAELQEGRYVSGLNKNISIRSFEVQSGVAYVDFNENLNNEVAGACAVTAIRSQIENTLIDLPDIDSVVISVNGDKEQILEP